MKRTNHASAPSDTSTIVLSFSNPARCPTCIVPPLPPIRYGSLRLALCFCWSVSRNSCAAQARAAECKRQSRGREMRRESSEHTSAGQRACLLPHWATMLRRLTATVFVSWNALTVQDHRGSSLQRACFVCSAAADKWFIYLAPLLSSSPVRRSFPSSASWRCSSLRPLPLVTASSRSFPSREMGGTCGTLNTHESAGQWRREMAGWGGSDACCALASRSTARCAPVSLHFSSLQS